MDVYLYRNYEDFVSRYPVANQALEENKRESRQLSDVLDASLLTLPSNCRQPLDFFLILPVQRLMRYKLLLQRIVSLCDGVDAQAFLDLQTALAAVEETIDAINDETPGKNKTENKKNY